MLCAFCSYACAQGPPSPRRTSCCANGWPSTRNATSPQGTHPTQPVSHWPGLPTGSTSAPRPGALLAYVGEERHIGKVVISHTAEGMVDRTEQCIQRLVEQKQRAEAELMDPSNACSWTTAGTALKTPASPRVPVGHTVRRVRRLCAQRLRPVHRRGGYERPGPAGRGDLHIGHLLAAAGVSGLIKVLRALKHK